MKKAFSKKSHPKTVRGIRVSGFGGPCKFRAPDVRACPVCDGNVYPYEYPSRFEGINEVVYGACENGHDVLVQMQAICLMDRADQIRYLNM
jgi:hypothetical protein